MADRVSKQIMDSMVQILKHQQQMLDHLMHPSIDLGVRVNRIDISVYTGCLEDRYSYSTIHWGSILRHEELVGMTTLYPDKSSPSLPVAYVDKLCGGTQLSDLISPQYTLSLMKLTENFLFRSIFTNVYLTICIR